MTEAAPQERVAQNVVTSENRAEFMDHRLDLMKPIPKPVETPVEAKTEVVEGEVKEDKTTAQEPSKEPVEKKNPINERFSKMAEQRRQAEAKAEAAEAKALAAEKKAAELEAKLTPKQEPVQEVGKAPLRAQFNTDDDYIQALTDHKVEEALQGRERKAQEEKDKQAQTQRQETWQKLVKELEVEIPDLKEKLDASGIKVSDEMNAAITDSPQGPRILNYLADNPEEAPRLGKLTVGQMYREIGKLEAKLESKSAPSKEKPELKVVEVSKAPPPINPLKGNNATPELPLDTDGNFKGDYKQWKALRKAGKI